MRRQIDRPVERGIAAAGDQDVLAAERLHLAHGIMHAMRRLHKPRCPATGGRLGTKLPRAGRDHDHAARRSRCRHRSTASSGRRAASPARSPSRRNGIRVERLDLLHQPVGQFLAGDDGQARNVVDRLFRIELGALPARPVEDVDQMALRSSSPSSNTANRPMGPAPMMATSVSMGWAVIPRSLGYSYSTPKHMYRLGKRRSYM